MAKTDIGLDIGTKIVNTRSVSVWWYLYVFSNTKASFEAQFMKKLSKTEAELKKSLPYKKKRVKMTLIYQ